MTRRQLVSALLAATVFTESAVAQQSIPTPRQVSVEDQYLWSMVTKLRDHRFHVNVPAKKGTTVVKILMARDGRLLEAEVARSSGMPEMDTAVVAALRQHSPYPPLPPEIPGSTATFRLPMSLVADE